MTICFGCLISGTSSIPSAISASGFRNTCCLQRIFSSIRKNCSSVPAAVKFTSAISPVSRPCCLPAGCCCLMPSLGRSKASPVPTRIRNLRLLPFRHRTFHPGKVPHLLFRTLPNPEFPQHRPPMQRNLPLPLIPIPLSQTPAARRPGQRSRRSSGKGWSMTEKP